MEEIIQILMRRDNLTRNEAITLIDECRADIQDVLAHADDYSQYAVYEVVTDIIADYLGLEPDYLEYLI